MNRNRIIAAVILAFFAVMPVISACDTPEKKSPYLLITVNLDEMAHPVSQANKLYAVFYVGANWSAPWLMIPSSSMSIVTPRLNIGNLPFYFEVWYDADGDGAPSAGDLFQGWNGVTNRGALLVPVALPQTDLMLLNIDLEGTNGTF